jgi:YD repeat-containing protein
VTAINPDGSSTRQLFDQNGLLISTTTSTIDSNHLLTSVTVSSTGTRTCTYAQPIPNLSSPYTIGEAYAGTYTYSCLPDALSGTVSASGNITALENVTVNGTTYSALKSEGTTSQTYTYPVHPALPGPTVSRSFTATHTQWTEPNIGAVVQLNQNYSYTTNAPSSYVVKSSRILIGYVNM